MEDETLEPESEAMAVAGVPPVIVLQQLMQMSNIASAMLDIPGSDERNLAKIAAKVISEYEIDKESRKGWEERSKAAIDLAMLVSEEKDYPFAGAANIKYPLLTTAALQFNARAYPAVVQGNRVAKVKTWGADPDGAKAARAERVSEHLSYQLVAGIPEWEEDTDRLLVMLPITGAMFRKVWYDPNLGRNCTSLLTPEKLVYNYYAKSFDSCPRVTEEMTLYPHEIAERILSGRFIEFDYKNAGTGDEDGSTADDDYQPHLFLEQHRLLDLDGDGYPEPYVVTVHKGSQKVVRITACYQPDGISATPDGKIMAIRRNAYYVRYLFWPSFDGGNLGLGFGHLLKDITESINTTLNQMLDAGHLSNVQGGIVSAAAGIREKAIRLEMGEWRVVKSNLPLNQAIMPIKYDGPSPVLFQLLGMLVESGREVAAIKDVLTGESRPNMTASATLALIEQGLQVFTAIYKRIHRSLKQELGLHANLNRQYLTPEGYNALFDGQQMFDPAQDYSESDMDILPISDPNVVSRMQELAKANFIREVAQGNPVVDQVEVFRRIMEAGQVEDIDALIAKPPQQDPMVQEMLAESARLELEAKEADIVKKTASALKELASIQGQQAGLDLTRSKLVLDAIRAELEAENRMYDGQGRLSGMEGQPSDPMGSVPAGAMGGQGGGGFGASPDELGTTGTGPMGEPASAGGL